MSLVLNTNISALMSQNSLTSSGAQLATALQQLSTGLRVNTAADDAAGYAITQGMTAQINGINQAARNANDGVSLAQTASGALTEVVNDLQTMRDLAVQSLNASNSSTDRADLDAQFQQLKADINSVSATTQFNGVNLLDGSFQGATFQVGANVGQVITMSSIASTSSSNLGKLFNAAATDPAAYTNTGAAGGTAVAAGDGGTLTLTVNGTAITTSAITLTGTQSTDLKTVAAAINQAVGGQGVVATVDSTGKGINLSSTTSQTVTVAYTAGTGTETLATFGLAASSAITTAGNTVNNADVKTVDGSNLVLVQIDAALQSVATIGAQLGAYQNRFQAAVSGLNIDSSNLSAARSQIQDTDYAAATSALSKAQILQQAGTAMVAQANTIPQNILTLLQRLP